MNKNEFLQKLKEDLSSLSDEERMNALKHYEEYFADAEEDQKEEEVITEFVSPEDLANKIQEEIEDLEKAEDLDKKNAGEQINDAQYQRNKKLRNIVIICMIPIWGPIAIAVVSVFLGVFIGACAVAFSGFAMIGAGVFCVVAGFINVFADKFSGFSAIGAGFLSAGLGIFIAYGLTKLAIVIFKSTSKFIKWISGEISTGFSRQSA